MSQITIRNHTEDVIRIAIYKAPAINPSQATIAWRVAAPPPGEQQTIEIPDGFSVVAGYAEDFSATHFKPSQTPFTGTNAAFSVNAQDDHLSGVIIVHNPGGIVANQVCVANNLKADALITIAKGGDAIYERQLITPGGRYVEDIRPSFCVAVIAQFILKGQHLISEEIAQTQLELPLNGVISVIGSIWDGYSLVVENQ